MNEKDEEEKYIKFLSEFNCFIDDKLSYIQEYQDIVKEIAKLGYQDLFDNEKDKYWADPWLLVLAKSKDAILITEESQKKTEKRKIPSILVLENCLFDYCCYT